MRLFVAAEVPEDVAATLLRWAPRDAALRPVPAESLHLTLAFLGERPEEDAERIGHAIAPLGRPVRALWLDEAIWLPPRRPSVLAVRLDDPDGALGRLQADVVAALADAVGFVPERRGYLPHVTVARVRRGARPPSDELPPLPAVGRFGATALTLFQSHLSPRGARYEALERVGL
jgi:2'-5' RNA ligase